MKRRNRKDEVLERKRSAIDFHVLTNPAISVFKDASAELFDGGSISMLTVKIG